MMQTIIREKEGVNLKNPILIEGLPGLGSVGKITVSYLIKQLKAKKFAELYSPFFPHHVVVNEDGSVRLLRAEFYFWDSPNPEKSDLILLTGDHQAQTVNGQYELASKILDLAEKYGIKKIITVGGYSAASEEAKTRVICVSTSRGLLSRMLRAGASSSPAGNPIVGAAGLLLGLARFRRIEATCLLGETRGYMPDPKAAKAVLKILRRALDLSVDLSVLEKDIEKSAEVLRKVEDVQKKMESLERTRLEKEEEKLTYIS